VYLNVNLCGRYESLTSTHDATSTEIETLTQEVSQWKFEAEKKATRIETLEANLADLSVSTDRKSCKAKDTKRVFRILIQTKLEEAESRLESLKALEAKIADLERALEEKSRDLEVRLIIISGR
jgi:chromosome segregation ATPase